MTFVLIKQLPISILSTIPSRLLRKFLTFPAQNITFINDNHVWIISSKEKKQQSSIRNISFIACLQFLYLNGDASFIWFTYSFTNTRDRKTTNSLECIWFFAFALLIQVIEVAAITQPEKKLCVLIVFNCNTFIKFYQE